MNKVIIAALLMLSANAYAQQTTLTLSDEYVDGDTKICVYSNAAHTETVEVGKNSHCRYTETFPAD